MSQSPLVFAGRRRVVSTFAGLTLAAVSISACLSGSAPRYLSEKPAAEVPAAAVVDPVTVEPLAALTAAPAVLWIRVEEPVDPARIALVHGHAGSAQVSQVRRGEISKALQALLVPVMIWSEEPADDGAAPGGSVVIAPSEALVPGDEYTLVSGEPARATAIVIALDDPAPILARAWPPPGASATARYAVWCGDAPLPAIDAAVELAPARTPGRILRGAHDGDRGARCLRFEASADAAIPGAPGQPPPSVSAGGALFRLDPRPIEGGGLGHAVEPLDCDLSEISFGPGCAQVTDDRLTVRAPDAPALWTITGAGIDRVLPTGAGERFVIAGLAPASNTSLEITVIDDRGERHAYVSTFATLASMPHLILNEVCANPLGPEPQQEWVEIFNDGTVPADVGGYTLIDVGGETVLPPGEIPPGGFALIVNQLFLEDDGVDPAPDPAAILLRVHKLGHGGLSNDGEPLSIRDLNGVVISRSPVGPKTKAGMSLARVTPAAPDTEKGSFALSKPTPGRANAP